MAREAKELAMRNADELKKANEGFNHDAKKTVKWVEKEVRYVVKEHFEP